MKLLVSDYDNTFSYNIEENIKKVNKFMKDNIFVIATGRSYESYITQKELYNINSNYLIINHGATILKKDKIIYNQYINNLEEIKPYLRLDKCEVNYYGYKNNITKVMLNYKDKTDALEVFNLMKSKDIKAFLFADGYSVEIVSSKVDKANAIKYIAKLENITDIYTIGDNYNDIEMIKNFKGYCMKNSVDEVKKYAIKETSVGELIEEII